MMRFALAALAALLLAGSAIGQDPKPAAAHTAADPFKCKKCLPAYEKALAYLKKEMGKASFPAKMVMGWLFLADARTAKELDTIVKEAMQWESKRGSNQHAQNWYPALAATLIAEVHKHKPTQDQLEAMTKLVEYFAKVQERNGGWFKWFEGAYKDRLDYPVKSLGFLNSLIYGFLWTAKTHGVKVPDEVMANAEKMLDETFTSEGLSYGTGQKGGDPTGARGTFLFLALEFAGQSQHRVAKAYPKIIPKRIDKMDQGHHIGAFHGLGLVLGCHKLGPQVYSQLTAAWLDKLIAKQEESGGLYIGDDGDAGGEPGLLNGNWGSTAAFALLIRLQDPNALKPPAKKAPKKKGGIFKRDEKPEDAPTEPGGDNP